MKFTTWIVIAVVLVIGLGAVFLLLHKNIFPVRNTGSNASAIATPKAVYAPSGKLTAFFPNYLLLGANDTIKSSYSVSFPSLTQSTVIFESSDSIDTIYNSYLAYFKSAKAKYELLNQQDGKQLASLYAINVYGDVSVQITPSGKLSSVTVSYLLKR